MSTTKSVKLQKNKVLTYTINKSGFKPITHSVDVTENKTININMIDLSLQDEPFQLGDRLFGISTFVDYFTPSGTYDVDSLKYISVNQTTGIGLTDIQITKGTSNTVDETETWLSKVEQDLQVVTAKGSSNTFIFTYNGSTWDITGALILTGQDISDYGISFEGNPTSGDVITVVETQYNKFAFFVLDSNYRNNKTWGSYGYIMPKQYPSNPQDCQESATYYNQYLFNTANLNDYPAFKLCKDIGTFILPNNIKINAMMPNAPELKLIWNNRVTIDSVDPIIQGGATTYNLTNWNFSNSGVKTCLESTLSGTGQMVWWVQSNGSLDHYGNGGSKIQVAGVVPIFEVPSM